MSVDFRQRTPAEYAQMLWRNKWVILLPTIAVALAVGYVVWRLPNTYESRSRLIIRPPQISTNSVPQLNDADLSARITSIGQVAVSRTSLEPLILKYDLYALERSRGVAIETLVERMQTTDIKIEVDRSRNDVENAFAISYRGRDPQAVRGVTQELAGKYVSGQTSDTQNTAVNTRTFFETQVSQLKAELDAIDSRRLQYMMQQSPSLPITTQSLISQLEGLRSQERNLTTEIGRLGDQRTALSNNLSLVEKKRQDDIANVRDQMTDPITTPAYAQFSNRLSSLKSELNNMLTVGRLRPKNPEVTAKKNEIAQVEGEMKAMLATHEAKVETRVKQLQGQTDISGETIKTNLKLIAGEIERQRRSLADTTVAIGQVAARLNQVPATTVQLEAIEREYNTKKVLYDDLLKQKASADLGVNVAVNSQGETIQVIDPANLPITPIAPKRQVLLVMGLVLGMGLGFMLAVAREAPGLLKVNTTTDAEHYTGLPVLISVPTIRTVAEVRNRRIKHLALAAAAVIIAVLSVPALIFALKLTRIFETLSGVS